METKTIPVAIITGFLGAGKTTLINRLLQMNPDINFLIIENEAGEINIDGALLEKSGNNNIYELTNGCICCSLNPELGTLLNSIILSNIRYGYILIEATGIADPGEIIQMFSGKRVQKYFKLDAVIGLVDAVLFCRQSNRFDEIDRQVAQSDIVLINKTDLVSSSQVTDVIHKIRSINPFARLEKVTFGHTENSPLLFSGAFAPSRIEKSIVDFTSLSIAKPEIPIKHAIQTFSYTLPGDLDMARLSEWLEQFLYKNAASILRIKGVLSIADMKHKIILQSVGNNFQVLQGSVWESLKNRTSHLVFIGSKLDSKAIEKNLYSLTTATNKASHL